MEQTTDVVAVVEEVGAALDARPAEAPSNLFRTDDPAEVLERATATANALAPVLRKQNMLASISGKDHVKIEGWTTLGSMLGVTAVGIWTKPTENGWEAKVNAQTLDGRVIGSAEAMCTRDEGRWKKADDYAIRSMAQTRAASKALASVLRFVVTLAGFSGTPAEEMGGVSRGGQRKGFASEAQRGLFERLLKDAGVDDVDPICDYANSAMSGGRDQGISRLIDALKDDSRRGEAVTWLEGEAGKLMERVAAETNGEAPEEPSAEAHDPSIPF